MGDELMLQALEFTADQIDRLPAIIDEFFTMADAGVPMSATTRQTYAAEMAELRERRAKLVSAQCQLDRRQKIIDVKGYQFDIREGDIDELGATRHRRDFVRDVGVREALVGHHVAQNGLNPPNRAVVDERVESHLDAACPQLLIDLGAVDLRGEAR